MSGLLSLSAVPGGGGRREEEIYRDPDRPPPVEVGFKIEQSPLTCSKHVAGQHTPAQNQEARVRPPPVLKLGRLGSVSSLEHSQAQCPPEGQRGCAVLCLVAQSCPALCHPKDCSSPGSSFHGILQARILEWVSMPSSKGSSQPRDRTQVSPIAGGFFTN